MTSYIPLKSLILKYISCEKWNISYRNLLISTSTMNILCTKLYCIFKNKSNVTMSFRHQIKCEYVTAFKLAGHYLQFLGKNLIPYLIICSHGVKNVSLDRHHFHHVQIILYYVYYMKKCKATDCHASGCHFQYCLIYIYIHTHTHIYIVMWVVCTANVYTYSIQYKHTNTTDQILPSDLCKNSTYTKPFRTYHIRE